MTTDFNRVLRELRGTWDIVDPICYKLEKRIEKSIIEYRGNYKTIAVYEGSYADNQLSKDEYWIRLPDVNTSYRPNKSKWGTKIVWFQFKYDYIKLL